MSTRIQKVGSINGIKPTGKTYTLSDIIQESYRVSYKAKNLKNSTLINLTESHIANIKKNPTNTKALSEDLDVLKGLSGMKDQSIKDLEEVDTTKKRRKRKMNSCKEADEEIKKIRSRKKPLVRESKSMKESWQVNRNKLNESLKTFRETAKTKVFYKELGKFNKKLSEGASITLSEAISLYKAANSCLTHLTVELDRNPKFLKAYCECTTLLSRDNNKLLESIQMNKIPDKSLLESFAVFTNILLESDAPEDLEDEIYTEDADMEELDDRDVLEEDADMEELDDRDVLDEDADMEELDDRDVLDEDADMEELDDRDVINETFDEDPVEDEDILEEDVTVDLDDNEINVLRSILGKILGTNENVETVPDEEEVPEIDDTEIPDIDDEDLEEDEDLEDEEYLNDEDIPEEDFEEESAEDELDEMEDPEEDPEDSLDGLDESEEDPEDFIDSDFELTESAIKRIKKSF